MRVRHIDVPGYAVFLAVSDLLWLILAIHVVVMTSQAVPYPFASQAMAPGHVAVIASISGCAFVMGLYQRSFLTLPKLFVRMGVSFLLSLGLVALMSRAAPDALVPFNLAFAVHVVAFGGFYVNRLVSARVAENRTFKRRIFVAGSAEIDQAIRELECARRPSRFVCVGSADWSRPEEDDPPSIVEDCRNLQVQEIVVANEEHLTPARTADLFACRLNGAYVSSYTSFVERMTHRVELTDKNAVRLAFSAGSRRNRISYGVKRTIDIAASLAILVFVLPVITVAALAVWLGRDGPIFYRQERVGLNGRVFSLLKFRSMRVDAEADGVARWAQQNDARVTLAGGFLRRSRIDEIPQLINVLRGEMSLVGPRPERPGIVRELQEQIPLYGYRHLVLPGITGWAQINYPYGASLGDAVEKTRYDLYYIKNGSIVLDIVILLQTIRVILMGEGSR